MESLLFFSPNNCKNSKSLLANRKRNTEAKYFTLNISFFETIIILLGKLRTLVLQERFRRSAYILFSSFDSDQNFQKKKLGQRMECCVLNVERNFLGIQLFICHMKGAIVIPYIFPQLELILIGPNNYVTPLTRALQICQILTFKMILAGKLQCQHRAILQKANWYSLGGKEAIEFYITYR